MPIYTPMLGSGMMATRRCGDAGGGGVRLVPSLSGFTVPSVTEPPAVSQTLWSRRLKRPVESVLAACLLLLAGPVLLAAMVLVKMTGPGSAFFKQVRTGRHGREFRPYKLRTMSAHRAPDPHEIVPLDHPEITSIGRLLRKLKIDELPQLVNVLRGEMALIGPRPTLPEQTRRYDSFQKQRLLIRPGMTGLAQVNGNTSTPWSERIKYDVHYVRTHGLLMDLGILFKTFGVILRGEQRYARPYEESPYARNPPGGNVS